MEKRISMMKMKAALPFVWRAVMPMLLLFSSGLIAQEAGSGSPAQSSNEKLEADNTGINKTDRKGQKLTAQDQAQGSRKDEEITRRIRSELISNEDLSSYGQNIKIITLDGIVTLRGPVKSAQERDWIIRSSQKVSGVRSIQNEITIAE